MVNPDDPGDAQKLLDWTRPLISENRPAPKEIRRAGSRGMTDSNFASVSIMSLATLRAVSGRAGRDLSPLRFRGNLWIDGELAPFEEFEWVGKTLTLGRTTLKVIEPITRCRATMANPDTGVVDTDTLDILDSAWNHQQFGINVEVIESGDVSVGDGLAIQ